MFGKIKANKNDAAEEKKEAKTFNKGQRAGRPTPPTDLDDAIGQMPKSMRKK